jgi:CubicO group peptidase (beta-lactamase class C family)
VSLSSNEILLVLEKAKETKIFSGYQVFSEFQGKTLSLFGGETSFWQPRSPVTESTYFDLGSVTKVVSTTSIFALGVQEKRWYLQDPLEKYIPEFKNTGYGPLTLGQLLSHTAGVLWWDSLYQKTQRSDLLSWFLKNEKKVLVTPPEKEAVYSDLGFLLLQLVLEKIGSLNELFLNQIALPLKLQQVTYPPLPKNTITAATEYVEAREELLQGTVFDRNCEALGGISAHAGLFASAKGVSKWASEWLLAWQGRSQWLSSETAKFFTKPVKGNAI